MLDDSTPGEEEELIELSMPGDSGDSAPDVKEPEPPKPFTFNPDVEDE